MARTSPQITDAESAAWTAWCDKNNVIHSDQQNMEFIVNYFENIWKEDITEANLDAAYPQIKDSLKHYVPGQQEFAKLYAALSPSEKEACDQWKFGKFGLKFSPKNGLALLTWLKAHGFAVTYANLTLAAGQQNVIPHLEFNESASRAQVRDKEANRKRLQSEDNGKPFFSEGMVPDGHGGYRSMTYHEQKVAKEAAERAKQVESQELPSASDAWTQLNSQLLAQGNARQQREVKQVYEYYKNQGMPERQIHTKLSRLVERYSS